MKANDTLRLPPIIKHVDVGCPPDRAFAIFTAEIGAWWPLANHSLGGEDAQTVAIEPRVGGRIVERDRHGREYVWGTVLDWSPPRRLRFTWRVGKAADSQQEVDVSFEPATAGCRVTLTHSGWENPEYRKNYDGGWDFVLGRYAERADA